MAEAFYDASDFVQERSSNEKFYLHNHNEYEIYMFLEGDSKYVVEEKNYNLSPGDVIVIRRHEMHRVYHNSVTKYRRFVLMLSPEFFKQNNCEEYKEAFSEDFFIKDNKINSEIVHSCGLYDAIMRLRDYSNNFTVKNTPVLNSIIIEIIYLINRISSFEAPSTESVIIKKVISHINANLKNEITLDKLAKEFYISKYHLCRTFKNSTGLTIHDYIKQKRLTIVKELVKEGNTLTDAAISAGFNDYSSFYRAYVKRYNENPRTALQN